MEMLSTAQAEPDVTAPAPRPTMADIQEAEAAVRMLQQILGNLHGNKLGASEEFKEVMEYYRYLSSGLQTMRKMYQEDSNERAQQSRAQLKPASGAAAAPVRPQPRTTAWGLDLRPAAATAAPSMATAPVPAHADFAAPAPPPAEAPPQVAAVDAPLAETVHLQESRPPTGLPLALPRFVSALGPAGSRAINRGPEVQRLNQLLAALGYDVEQEGTYDAKTFRAVSELQKAHRVSVNGLVGLETRRLINEMVTG